MGFVKYDGSFMARKCFTNLGRSFALACRALNIAIAETKEEDEIIRLLRRIKSNIQRQGLVTMYENPEWESHNMWIAIKLLKEFKTIHWNYFVYTLYSLDKNLSLEETIKKIKDNKDDIKEATLRNEKNNELANTVFSYIRAFLEECEIIKSASSKSKESTITEDGLELISILDKIK